VREATAPSIVTWRLPVRSMVENSAIDPMPSAIGPRPLFQFPMALQT